MEIYDCGEERRCSRVGWRGVWTVLGRLAGCVLLTWLFTFRQVATSGFRFRDSEYRRSVCAFFLRNAARRAEFRYRRG
jgi:hypothetical protein